MDNQPKLYRLLLTPRGEHRSLLLPTTFTLAAAIEHRDACLAEIATKPEVAEQWADVDVVHDGWPHVNVLGIKQT